MNDIDDLSAMRGCVVGACISMCLWIAIFAALGAYWGWF